MTGIAVVASAISAAGVSTDERALRRNPAMREAEERIRNLEALLERERRENVGQAMLAGIRGAQSISQTKRRLGYVDGLVHFAVVGSAGSGKSSLINSIRGLQAGDPGAADVGTSETTMEVTRYEDPDLKANPYVWYDVPGVGTLNQPEAHYFVGQGLFIFDCIIVVFDIRFTAADIAILKCCKYLKIPTYIVRSKALMHIQNTIADTAREGSPNENEAKRWQAAREAFERETQANVNANLKAAGLEEQHVYIVERATMLHLVRGEDPGEFLLDEANLMRTVLEETRRRRDGH